MPNPTLSPSAPGFASIVACYWVSDQIEISPGVFGSGAWEAKNGVFHPAWGAPTAVACGSTGRNGLKFNGQQGIDLATVDGHTSHILDMAGPEMVVVAVARKSSSTTEARVIQNCERFGSQLGIKFSFSSSGTITAKVNDSGGPNSAFSTSAAVAGQLRAYTYRKSTANTPGLYFDASGSSSATGSSLQFNYGTLDRRAAIGNWGSTANLSTGEHDTYLIVVYNSDNWMEANDVTALTPIGTSEAALLGGSFYNAYLQFAAPPATVSVLAALDSAAAALSFNLNSATNLSVAATVQPVLASISFTVPPPASLPFQITNGSSNWALRSDLIVYVRNLADDTPVAVLTGVATDAQGAGVLNHVNIVLGFWYRVTFVIPAGGAVPLGAEGTWKIQGV